MLVKSPAIRVISPLCRVHTRIESGDLRMLGVPPRLRNCILGQARIIRELPVTVAATPILESIARRGPALPVVLAACRAHELARLGWMGVPIANESLPRKHGHIGRQGGSVTLQSL
jgi:hypothetical protein